MKISLPRPVPGLLRSRRTFVGLAVAASLLAVAGIGVVPPETSSAVTPICVGPRPPQNPKCNVYPTITVQPKRKQIRLMANNYTTRMGNLVFHASGSGFGSVPIPAVRGQTAVLLAMLDVPGSVTVDVRGVAGAILATKTVSYGGKVISCFASANDTFVGNRVVMKVNIDCH
jgi:hypothetical protein